MAKSKHSIALFEVVQSAKRQNRSSTDMLRTPKWWFKSSRTKMPSACPTPSEPSVMSMPTPVAAPAVVESPAVSSVPAPRNPGVDLKLDPEKQRITFHVSYTSAAVTAFSIIVVLTMAYVVGTHMASGPSHAVAGMTTEQLLKTPARPEVLNVKPETPKNVTSEVTPVGQTPSQSSAGSESAQPKQTTVAENREAAATASRFPGRNYVVMQIFKDEPKATEIAKRLTDAGVPCSVTRGLEGYAEDSWYCVVGLTGFEKLSGNPTYKQYLSTIMSLNEKWSAADSKFKKLQPQSYKWKAAG